MKHISIFWMIILNLLIIPTIFANQQQPSRTFIIGVQSSNEFPLYHIDDKNEFHGIFKDFLDDFAKKNNITFKYLKFPKKVMLSKFLNGEIDFKFPDNPFWSSALKRSKKILYSNPIHYYIEGMLIRSKDNFPNLHDIYSLGIAGEIIPWSLHHDLELKKIKVSSAKNCKVLIKELIDEDINAAYCNFHVANYYIKEFGLKDKIIFSTNLPKFDDYYYLSTIKHQEILEKFNLWIEQNKHLISKTYKDLE